MSLDTRIRALFLGFATGCRSTYGLAALVRTAPARTAATPIVEHALSTVPARVIAGLAAAGETTADKLPQAPSRLDPPGLPLRVVAGAGCGALVARRDGVSPVLPAAIGAAGALATSFAGARFRAVVASRLGHDAWGAVIEDGVAAGFALLGVRR